MTASALLGVLTYPQIDPVFLQIGPIALRWYGRLCRGHPVRLDVRAPSRGQREALAERRVAHHQDRHRRLHRLDHGRHRGGRAPRLDLLLRFRPHRRRPALGLSRLGGRHVLPWRPHRRDDRDDPVLPLAQGAAVQPDRRGRRLGALRPVLRAHRQLHQRRALGRADHGALGDGVSPCRAGAAPPEPALRGGPGRDRPVPHSARPHPPLRRARPAASRRRRLHPPLRLRAHLRGVLPHAGRAARLSPRHRLDHHGHGAFRADAPRRPLGDRDGAPARLRAAPVSA